MKVNNKHVSVTKHKCIQGQTFTGIVIVVKWSEKISFILQISAHECTKQLTYIECNIVSHCKCYDVYLLQMGDNPSLIRTTTHCMYSLMCCGKSIVTWNKLPLKQISGNN